MLKYTLQARVAQSYYACKISGRNKESESGIWKCSVGEPWLTQPPVCVPMKSQPTTHAYQDPLQADTPTSAWAFFPSYNVYEKGELFCIPLIKWHLWVLFMGFSNYYLQGPLRPTNNRFCRNANKSPYNLNQACFCFAPWVYGITINQDLHNTLIYSGFISI